MCGLYKRQSDEQRIAEAFQVGGDLSHLEPSPDDDIRPTAQQPIIRQNRERGERDLIVARWGFVPGWHKPGDKLPGNLFNARSEGVESAAMWRRAFTEHRCLVPADSFYEWKKLRPKNNPKFEFELKDHQPFAFAGLWGAWKNQGTGEWLQSFTILTTDPNELMEPIHTRMPVILHRRDYDRWLSRGAKEQPPLDLLRPFEAEAMTMHLSENAQGDLLAERNSQ